jgi:hypothetical protein
MRIPALLLAALLLPAGLALAEGERVERLHVGSDHPGPAVHLRVYEQDCTAHHLAWAGWFTAADAAVWAWEDRTLAGAAALDQRLERAALAGGAEAIALLGEVAQRWPTWIDPLRAALWALDRIGDEDVCAVGALDLTTGIAP